MPKIDPTALRNARKNQKPTRISQQILADRVGVDKRTIAAWESKKPEGMPSISEKNLKKLAQTLKVSVENLTGERPMASMSQGDKHRLSAEISSTAMFSYDVLEDRYGLTKAELIEAAPMLFEALNHIFLKKRQEKLNAVKAVANTLEAILPNPMDFLLVHDGRVPGWGPEAWGVEASLDFEQSQIDRCTPFTESGWSEIHGGCASNRFADMLFELEVPVSRLAIVFAEGVERFPDYLVGLEELRDLTGVTVDRPISQKAKQAAYAIVDGSIRLTDIPSLENSDARIDWVIAKAPALYRENEWGYDWEPFPDYPTGDMLPRARTQLEADLNAFPIGAHMSDDDAAELDWAGSKAEGQGDNNASA